MRQALPADSAPPGPPSRRTGWFRLSTRLVSARQPGQSVVEAALTAMMVILVLLTTLQLSLVAAQRISAMYVAQATARWLAVNIDTEDSELTNRGNMVAAGLPGLGGGGLASTTASPGCLARAPSGPLGKCAGRNSGDPITVTVTTNLAAVMFLPVTFGVPPLQFQLPTSMPPVRFTVMLE